MDPKAMLSAGDPSQDPAAQDPSQSPDQDTDKAPVSFMPPKGLKIPDDISKDGTFEVMATVKMGDDGMLTLQALDGEPLEGSDAEEKSESPDEAASEGDDDNSFLGAMEKGSPQSTPKR